MASKSSSYFFTMGQLGAFTPFVCEICRADVLRIFKGRVSYMSRLALKVLSNKNEIKGGGFANDLISLYP